MGKPVIRTSFICLVLADIWFVSPAESKAFDFSREQSECIATSLRLGASKAKKYAQCYDAHAKRLAESSNRKRSQRGLGLDDNLRASSCAPHFVIDRVPSLDESEVAHDPQLSKSYLQRFQKRLIPYGKRIAECYASLARAVVPLNRLKKGRLMIELEIGSSGRARQVVLTEETKLDGHVTGCVVRELCGFWASPPPGGKSFYLELPFTFKKAKDKAPSKKSPRP